MIKSSCLFFNGFLFFLVTLSVTQFPSEGYAQYLTGPVSSALGGAGVAANEEAEQFLYNPGALTHSKSLSLGSFFSDGDRGENEHDKFTATTVTDNTSDAGIAGGFAFVRREREFDVLPTREEIFGQFALAAPIYQFLSAGISVEHYRQDEVGGSDYNQTDITVGALYNPNARLGVGLVFRNLLGRDDEVPAHLQLQDQIIVGVNYIFMRQFRGRFDVVEQVSANPEKNRVYKGGIESYVDAFLVLRAGYQVNELEDRNYYSLGIGFTGPRLKIDYSYVKNEDFSGGAMHSVDFRLPL